MSLGEYFCINAPKVVYEAFDDEVVVINLDKGHYYSLTKAGAALWNLILAGLSIQQMVQVVSERFDATPAHIETGIRQFSIDLVREQLLVPMAAPQLSATAPQSIGERPNRTKLPFEGLGVQKFTDMAEMLLLDPIHEVDETGWPNVKRA